MHSTKGSPPKPSGQAQVPTPKNGTQTAAVPQVTPSQGFGDSPSPGVVGRSEPSVNTAVMHAPPSTQN